MAYKKTYKRKTYKRKPRKQAGMSVVELASKAYTGFKIIKGLVNSELYAYSKTPMSSTGVGTTPGVTLLVDIPIGNSSAERTGNSLLLKSIALNLQYTWTSSTGQAIRYWIVHDKQQISDTVPTFTDIFNNRGINSMRNVDTLDRFSILKSGYYTQNSNINVINTSLNLTFKQHHVKYNGPLGTDIQKGGIYFVSIAYQNSFPVGQLIDSRVHYHDN